MDSAVLNKKQQQAKLEEEAMDDKREEGIGQGQLYSPQHAINLDPHNSNLNNNQNNSSVSDNHEKITRLKEKLLEKLTAVTSKTTSSNQQAGNLIETVIRDASMAAQGITKDAMQRIKSRLVDLFPSLTSKMVDDAEKESIGRDGEEEDDDDDKEASYKRKTIDVSPTSSQFNPKL